VKSVGGELLASRLWNEQKLAYPINGHRKGAYWLTYFRPVWSPLWLQSPKVKFLSWLKKHRLQKQKPKRSLPLLPSKTIP